VVSPATVPGSCLGLGLFESRLNFHFFCKIEHTRCSLKVG
jgi:hypothetical protein